jgi:GntR family transcriptional regulator, transcriptional repressor for pyruvate dehydrogenase complex
MPSPTQTKPPARPLTTRSEQISTILRDEVLSGQYRPGERLPSERDLAARFATSRGVIREAFKKLDQLGIASVQRGGARVVPITECTLDVLGPLLDLDPIPDPKLVDEVLQIFGVLMDTAARIAVEKASDQDLATASLIIDEMLADGVEDARRHEALRRLGTFFVSVADHLVLQLIINGLRTTFIVRMHELGIRPKLDGESHREIAAELRSAVQERDVELVGQAMRRLNSLFRDSARSALRPVRSNQHGPST